MNRRTFFQTWSFQTSNGSSRIGAARSRANPAMPRLALALGLLLPLAAPAEDWPQFRGPNRDSVWHETGILQTFPAEGLKVRWRAPLGAGNSSPVVARGLGCVHGC